MTVTDIPDAAMLVLMGLCSGEPLVVRGGELSLASAGRLLPVEVEILDLLELAGWVYVGEAGALPTRNGQAALREWLRKRFPGRRCTVSRLRPAKLTAVKSRSR